MLIRRSKAIPQVPFNSEATAVTICATANGLDIMMLPGTPLSMPIGGAIAIYVDDRHCRCGPTDMAAANIPAIWTVAQSDVRQNSLEAGWICVKGRQSLDGVPGGDNFKTCCGERIFQLDQHQRFVFNSQHHIRFHSHPQTAKAAARVCG